MHDLVIRTTEYLPQAGLRWMWDQKIRRCVCVYPIDLPVGYADMTQWIVLSELLVHDVVCSCRKKYPQY